MSARTIVSLAMSCAMLSSGVAAAPPTFEVVARSDVPFQPLNPARGDASPQAGVLWGDIEKDVPSGALIVFADGFSSPPHIHNITYRAVVISGAVHNDDPKAQPQWMGPGSFWTQPAGESHITAAAKGSKGTAFLEILEGPYLVKPSSEAFDNGERPVNIDARNVIWLNTTDILWLNPRRDATAAGASEIAFLWGRPETGRKNGTMLKIPADQGVELHGNGSWLRAVVIQGETDHQLPTDKHMRRLVSGSYFGSSDRTIHKVACRSSENCLIYVSTEGQYQLIEE